MVVISDTTAVSNLFLTGKLWILKELYSEVVLPNAVFQELERLESSGWKIDEIRNADWIKVEQVQQPDLVVVLLEVLDRGEAEAITLARELNADLLIIDEVKGRNYAKKLHIPIIGVVGVLLQAKQNQVIGSVKEALLDLKNGAGFWISDALWEKALELAGEQ